MQVMDDVSEQRRRHEAYLADRDLEGLLEATNARRRSKGHPSAPARTSAGSSAPRPAPARTNGPDRLARCLIIGCGCHGRELARALLHRGHAVRGTTRSPERAPEIEAAGAEPFIADPDRIATLMPALDNVAVVCVLLGSANGEREHLEALDGSRLEMLLTRLIDTTVRGVVYQAHGTVSEEVWPAARSV